MIRRASLPKALLLTASLALGACDSAPKTDEQSPPPPPSPPTERVAGASDPDPQVDKLELHALPTVVNLDDKPGPDGVEVRLYLFQLKAPLAVALRSGTVEFLLYDGRITPSELAGAKPLHIWSYTAEQLKPFAGRSLYGAGYATALSWGDQVPKSGTITVSARLLRSNSRPLYAQPLNLAVGPR